jgi:hypothetical protein
MKNLNEAPMDLAPVVLFVYNRAECTLKTLEHLKLNVLADQSELFIYSDGPKIDANAEDLIKIQDVRGIILKEKWCKEVHIIESLFNHGLADSIINGVTEIVNRYGKIIVLEDDLLTSMHFLEYMNTGLNFFEYQSNVFQIVGYTAPIKTKFRNEAFFLPMSSTLGWGTWARAWEYFEKIPQDYTKLLTDKKLRKKFDLDNSYPYSDMLIRQMETNVDSWGIRWCWAVFKQHGISLFPDRSLIAHIGFDQQATHTKNPMPDFNKYWTQKYKIEAYPETIKVNYKFYSKIKHFYKKGSPKSLGYIFFRTLIKMIKGNFKGGSKSKLLN